MTYHDHSVRTSRHQPLRMKNQIPILPEPSVFELFVAFPRADGRDPDWLGLIVLCLYMFILCVMIDSHS